MDQGISTMSMAHFLRLALVVCGAVFGLLVLSFFVSGSSANAAEQDDSPDTLGGVVGGLVSDVTELVPAVTPITQPVVQAVQSVANSAPASTVVTPVTTAVDETVQAVLEPVGLGEVLGTDAPVGAIVTPVTTLLDVTLGDTAQALGPPAPGAPTLSILASAVDAGADAALTTAAALVAAVPADAAAIAGSAQGALAASVAGFGLFGTADDSAGTTPTSTLFATAMAGAGLLVLLMLRRQRPTTPQMPGSPVFETDSSPD